LKKLKGFEMERFSKIIMLSVLFVSGFFMSELMGYDFYEIDKIMNTAIADSAWPGGVLIIGRNGENIYEKAYGFHTYDKKVPTRSDDIFDLASITKVMSTTSAIMSLYDKGIIDLDEYVHKYIPEFRGQSDESTAIKRKTTLRHLLTHTSGIPAYKNYNRDVYTPDLIIEDILSLDFRAEPGTSYEYSCLGFITLGELVKRVSGLLLDEYVQENIFKPLNMNYTQYNPPVVWLPRIAPTEYSEKDQNFIRGRVHDGIAAGLAGISGNAGLFSTAPDMAIFAKMMLNKGQYKGVRIFKPETVELFTHRANILENNSRCLGWDSPQGISSSGIYAGQNSFGHTGFTGTSFWIDPDNQVYVILLTNAVHPNRDFKDPAYFEWRQLVHSKAYETMELTSHNPETRWRDRWQDPAIRDQYKKQSLWKRIFK